MDALTAVLPTAGSVCSVCFFCFVFNTTQDLLRGGFTHSGLGPPHVSHYSRKCPHRLPMGQSTRGIFSIDIPSFQMTLVCVKLINKLTSTEFRSRDKTLATSNLERKVSILPAHSYPWEKSGQKCKAGTIEGYCFLAHSGSYLTGLLFFYF